MPCDQDSTQLSAWLDGELPSDQTAAVQQHLAGCERCAVELATLVRMKRDLRTAAGRFTPSAGFKHKIQQQVARSSRRQWSWRTALLPAAVTVAALVIAAMLFTGNTRRTGTLNEVADLHIGALASANPLDVVSTDRHTVKPWFQGRIPFAFNLPEFSGTDFTLLGARMVYLHQQPGAQLFVARGQHKISVLIFQESPATETPTPTGVQNLNTFSIETWHSGPLRFYVIGDTAPAELHKLAQTLMQANQ